MGAGPCSDWEKAGVGKARETTPAFINTRKPGRVRWVSPGGDVGCRPRAGLPAALIGTTPGAPGAASCNRSRPCSAGSHNRSAVDAARAGDTPRRRWSRRRARELRDAKRRMAARRTTSRRRVQARRRDGPDPQRSRRKPRCPPPDTAAPHGRCQRRGAAPYGAGATCGTPYPLTNGQLMAGPRAGAMAAGRALPVAVLRSLAGLGSHRDGQGHDQAPTPRRVPHRQARAGRAYHQRRYSHGTPYVHRETRAQTRVPLVRAREAPAPREHVHTIRGRQTQSKRCNRRSTEPYT